MPRLSTEKKTARSDLFRSVGLRVATAAVCYFQSRRNQPTTIDSWKNSRSAEKVWVFAAFRKGKKKKKALGACELMRIRRMALGVRLTLFVEGLLPCHSLSPIESENE